MLPQKEQTGRLKTGLSVNRTSRFYLENRLRSSLKELSVPGKKQPDQRLRLLMI